MMGNVTVSVDIVRIPGAHGEQTKKTINGLVSCGVTMQQFVLEPTTGVFLFEDHKIARDSFVLPDNCRKVSTRAWLLFLEQKVLN